MPAWPGKAGAGGDFLCALSGTGRKRRGLSRQRHHFPDFCRGIRHAAGFRPGFPDHLPQNTTVKPPAGGSSGIRSTSQASPLDRICSTHSLTRYISTAENVLPGSGWHRAPRAGFRHLHRASRVIAFLHHRAKATRLAGQQRLTGGGQRRTNTPRIFCHR